MNNECNCSKSLSTGGEYPCKKLACIKEQKPDCMAAAVIPSITVETADGITNLANCLVHVLSTNTTYYVDDKHRILITWAGPVDIPGYDMETNPDGYKNQIVTDTENQVAVIYDAHGVGFTFGIEQGADVQDAVNAKIDEMAANGELADIVMDVLALRSILAYDTVADMKLADNLSDGAYVETYGFYAKGDGGGAKYKVREIVNTDVVDNMTLFALADEDLVAELVSKDVHTRQFGAYGDGTHDDTVALQKAIDYALDTDCGIVNVDNGKYLISDTLEIPDLKTIKISGNFELGDADAVLVYGAEIVQTAENKAIFEFKGNNYRSEISNIRLQTDHVHTGIVGIKGNTRVAEFIFDKIDFHGGFSKCIDIPLAGIGVISNCIFSHNELGIDMQYYSAINLIYNNFCNNNVNIKVGTIDGCKFDGNWFESSGTHASDIGILFQAPCSVHWSIFQNNQFNMDTTAVLFDGTTNITEKMALNMLVFNNDRFTGSAPMIIDMKNAGGTINQNANNSFKIIIEDCIFNNVTSGQAISIDVDFLGNNEGLRLINTYAYSSYAGGAANMFTLGQANTANITQFENGLITNGCYRLLPVSNVANIKNGSLWSTNDVQLYFRDGSGSDKKILLNRKGTTSQRPTTFVNQGDVYYDTTLGKPIWWTGTGWVLADGTAA